MQPIALNSTTSHFSNVSENVELTLLVTGCSGFIGSHLVNRLLTSEENKNYKIRCMSRNVRSIEDYFDQKGKNIKYVAADASKHSDLVKAMTGVDTAFYLIHSMEGSSKDWKKFAERDRRAAENFARAASECNVKRIIYLGGLVPDENGRQRQEELSEHMKSRIEVGEILKKSSAKVTIFRAAIILGQGGGSFQMLQYLVERLPLMICPKWVLTKSQPIALDDVINYLIKSIESKETEGRSFDLGGPDIMTYIDMMTRYGKMLDKSVKILIIPFLTPKLSSYWIDLITPVKASLARPLIESLKHEAIVREESVKNIIPFRLKTFEEAIDTARREENKQNNNVSKRKEYVTHSASNKILLVSLLLLAVIGSTYYILDGRPEIYSMNWLVLSGIWYFGIALSIFFVRNGARLGAITAGTIGWLTLAFWLIDNIYTISGNSLLASSPGIEMTIRNFIGAVVAGLVVASSHNVFHKIRIHEL